MFHENNTKIGIMNFLKTFLAGLLAFVVGSVLSFFLWFILLIGIVASMGGSSPVIVPSESILKIDLAETVTDAPMTTRWPDSTS